MVEIRCKMLGLLSVERWIWWRSGVSSWASCQWRDAYGEIRCVARSRVSGEMDMVEMDMVEIRCRLLGFVSV